MKSLFISFEGPEGSGKTTQSRDLVDYLMECGYSVSHTREPGGTAIGQQIRTVLLEPENTDMRPLTEFLLFSASRAQLVSDIIQPELARGAIVVCDRFFDSSYAYQGHGHGVDFGILRSITEIATGGLVPDLTFLLDIDPEIGLMRRRDNRMRLNRLDEHALGFHERARRGFHDLANADPERWVVLNANTRAEDVQGEIIMRVTEALGQLEANRKR